MPGTLLPAASLSQWQRRDRMSQGLLGSRQSSSSGVFPESPPVRAQGQSLREEMDSTGATPPRLSALPTPTPGFLMPPGLPERAPRALTTVLTLSWSREAPCTGTRGWVGRNPSARGWRFTGREVLPSASPAGSCGITG